MPSSLNLCWTLSIACRDSKPGVMFSMKAMQRQSSFPLHAWVRLRAMECAHTDQASGVKSHTYPARLCRHLPLPSADVASGNKSTCCLLPHPTCTRHTPAPQQFSSYCHKFAASLALQGCQAPMLSRRAPPPPAPPPCFCQLNLTIHQCCSGCNGGGLACHFKITMVGAEWHRDRLLFAEMLRPCAT